MMFQGDTRSRSKEAAGGNDQLCIARERYVISLDPMRNAPIIPTSGISFVQTFVRTLRGRRNFLHAAGLRTFSSPHFYCIATAPAYFCDPL
jgi:hypothetical protein